ncbi:hypothetical protein IBZ20DMU1_47 [Acinetobacter phage DMU1]|nr:hypothetical protein IBZ20DMU1_47 [Acinetobacter phage DMU1]
MKTITGFMALSMIAIAAIILSVISIVALTCGAIIFAVAYSILYVIGALSVLVVSIYMWWYSLLLKVIHLDHD